MIPDSSPLTSTRDDTREDSVAHHVMLIILKKMYHRHYTKRIQARRYMKVLRFPNMTSVTCSQTPKRQKRSETQMSLWSSANSTSSIGTDPSGFPHCRAYWSVSVRRKYHRGFRLDSSSDANRCANDLEFESKIIMCNVRIIGWRRIIIIDTGMILSSSKS